MHTDMGLVVQSQIIQGTANPGSALDIFFVKG